MKYLILVTTALCLFNCIAEPDGAGNSAYLGNPKDPGLIRTVGPNGFTFFDSETSTFVKGKLEEKYFNIAKNWWKIPIALDPLKENRLVIVNALGESIRMTPDQFNYVADTLTITNTGAFRNGAEFEFTAIY